MKIFIKRSILFLGMLSVASVNAKYSSEAYRELNNSQVVSAFKAAGTAVCIYYSLNAALKYGNECCTAIGDKELQDTVATAVPTLGLCYVAWELTWDYLRPQLKHALAIN